MIKMRSIKEINEFIDANLNKVNEQYRLKFHMMPPVGWMNDPNGLVFFKDNYHICYQYNPFNSLPGTMHWGQFVSKDLIKYEDVGVVIAPTKEHTSIFSGGAIEIDGEVNAVYTLHYEHEGVKREEVYLSKSKDGINFTDFGCVFDNETLPKNICREDFRDPCPVKINDTYYVFIGAKDVEINQGLVVVLKGDNLEHLTYDFTIGPFYELGDMGECPSYFRVDGKDVILASGCRVKQQNNNYKNENSSVFIVGDVDFINKKFELDFVKEIDKGDVFYAPQFIRGLEEPVMGGWLEMWGKPYPTHNQNHGWTGALSIPRKLEIKNNDIYQIPVATLEKYYKKYQTDSNTFDITFEIEPGGELVVSGGKYAVRIGLDEQVYLNTMDSNNENGCIRKTNETNSKCIVRALFDTSSVEVFVEGGKEVISSRIYLDKEYQLTHDANVKIISLYEIGVD